MAEIEKCQTSNTNPNEVSDKLAKMLILFVDKYSQKGNWRGYSYIDEMRQDALYHLVCAGPKTEIPVVLRFNSVKSQNPFAYITTCIHHIFIRTLKLHQRQQDIKDEVILSLNGKPSSGYEREDNP